MNNTTGSEISTIFLNGSPIVNGEKLNEVFNNNAFEFDAEEFTVTLDDQESLLCRGVELAYAPCDAKGVDSFNNVTDVNDIIVSFFILSREKEAWDIIERYVEDVDFEFILRSGYFILDSNRIEVFKYLYQNDKIDTATYGYFNVVSGKVFDEAFLNEATQGLNLHDSLEVVREWYNGIDPREAGFLKADGALKNLIIERVKSASKPEQEFYDAINYFFGKDAFIVLGSNFIAEAIHDDYIPVEYLSDPMYTVYVNDRDEAETLINDIIKKRGLMYLTKLNFDMLDYYKFINDIVHKYSEESEDQSILEFLLTITIKSCAFVDYPMTVISTLKNNGFGNVATKIITMSSEEYLTYLPYNKYMYVYMHMNSGVFLNDITKDLIMTPYVCNKLYFIYNVFTDATVMLINGERGFNYMIWEGTEELLAAIDEWYNSWVADGEVALPKVHSICNSEEEYHEVMLQAKDFYTRLSSYKNN